jgi:hypothetical protein
VRLLPVRLAALVADVAVDAFPLKLAVIVPAEKLPLASRATIALAVLELVAVVAELDTLPAVEIVSNFVSGILLGSADTLTEDVESIVLLESV